jgi:hypothetical protein
MQRAHIARAGDVTQQREAITRCVFCDACPCRVYISKLEEHRRDWTLHWILADISPHHGTATDNGNAGKNARKGGRR